MSHQDGGHHEGHTWVGGILLTLVIGVFALVFSLLFGLLDGLFGSDKR